MSKLDHVIYSQQQIVLLQRMKIEHDVGHKALVNHIVYNTSYTDTQHSNYKKQVYLQC